MNLDEENDKFFPIFKNNPDKNRKVTVWYMRILGSAFDNINKGKDPFLWAMIDPTYQ
jgi:hypothetical protein